jgi:hypothetical protein
MTEQCKLKIVLDHWRVLASTQIRIQSAPIDSVRRHDDHYYLFTEHGQSIDQKLIDEGLELT